MRKIDKGFTLIELMIVVSIIGILAVGAIPSLQQNGVQLRGGWIFLAIVTYLTMIGGGIVFMYWSITRGNSRSGAGKTNLMRNYGSRRPDLNSKQKQALVGLSVLYFLVVTGVYVLIAPTTMNWMLYRFVYIHLGYWVILGAAGIIVLFLFQVERQTWGIILAYIVTVVLTIFGCVYVYGHTGYLIYTQQGQFTQRESMVAVDTDLIRFTPLPNAHVNMDSSINTATEQVNPRSTYPIITEKGFGFISPIIPDGFIPSIQEKNPGFMLFYDNFGLDKNERIKRIEQEYEIGEGMVIFDNLYRNLYQKDWSAVYEDAHYLQINPPGEPEKYVAVVPKIEYEYNFPFFFVPVWSGVMLVFDDGSIDDVSSEELLERYPRLENKWMGPLELAAEYVESQNFAKSWYGLLYNWDGKLAIPELQGNNKFPLVTQGVDGVTYLVVATHAKGQGEGLYRMYYYNGFDFGQSYYEYSDDVVTFGPAAARKRVKSHLPKINWHEKGGQGSSGSIDAIEATYITKKINGIDKLFWKYTITTIEYAGLSSTVIIEAEGGEAREFEERLDFHAWLNDTDGAAEEGEEQSVQFIPPVAVESDDAPANRTVTISLKDYQRLQSLISRLNSEFQQIQTQ